MSKLTARHKLFAERVAIHDNATQAYKEAGFKAKGNAAEVNAHKLRNTKPVSEYIQKLRDKASEENGLTQDWVIKRLMWLSDSTIDDVMDVSPNGVALKDFKDLTKEKKFAVQAVSEVIRDNGTGQQSIKMADKKGPLEILWRHMGGTEKLEISEKPFIIKRVNGEEVHMGTKKGKK